MMAPWPGGRIETKLETPNMPRFEIVKVPVEYSSGESFFSWLNAENSGCEAWREKGLFLVPFECRKQWGEAWREKKGQNGMQKTVG